MNIQNDQDQGNPLPELSDHSFLPGQTSDVRSDIKQWITLTFTTLASLVLLVLTDHFNLPLVYSLLPFLVLDATCFIYNLKLLKSQ